MRYLIILSLCFVIIACGLFEADEEELAFCDMDFKINGISWNEIHPDDEIVEFRATSSISPGQNAEIETHDILAISCMRRYKSNYVESMRFRFAINKNAQPEDLTPKKVDFLNSQIPRIEHMGFSEVDFDVVIGRYQRYDSTYSASAELTHIDAESNRVRGVFEGRLIVNEDNMSSQFDIDTRRLPDTLHITSGSFEVEFVDVRPESNE